MKKILFSLVALVCSMSMNAQVMKVMKGNTVVATYTAEQADNVVFEEAQASTTGTAKATIGGSEVDVNWVQLWAGGPKFADRNVGANSVTDRGNTMTFAKAIAAGDDYAWGSLWCTPSKDQLNELLLAASTGSEKVTCTFAQNGFVFTGKTTGYESNSVFFPIWDGFSNYGFAYYLSGTADGSGACYMDLLYDFGSWSSRWDSSNQDEIFLVRPVLKEN